MEGREQRKTAGPTIRRRGGSAYGHKEKRPPRRALETLTFRYITDLALDPWVPPEPGQTMIADAGPMDRLANKSHGTLSC